MFHCLTADQEISFAPRAIEEAGGGSSHQIKTFRLAVTASGEYTEFHGGTVEAAKAAIDTVINRVNEIYERELGVRLLLIPRLERLIFTNKNTDPFTSSTPSVSLLQQVQDTIDQIIGTENYDVGILLNTGTYGLAYFGSVCDPARKGSACMGMPEPVGEQFSIYLAHEIAHQFGANHTFNSNQDPCGGGRNAATAVEPGTGSTLMSYAGLPCGNDSLQPLMDDYFHAESIREIRAFLETISCAQIITTSNQPPIVSAPAELWIPRETPFVLTATIENAGESELTFSWEQTDIGPAQTLFDPDNGASPLFRSFPPGTNAFRIFPKMESLLQNAVSPGEKLPITNRTMHFRVTVRDVNNPGTIGWADAHVGVIDSAGPFRIASHNTGGTFRGEQTVSWNVARTTNAPLNASHVNILLSTNGGDTFSMMLAGNIPNVGTAIVNFPPINSPDSRLKIEPVGQVFFDINDGPFSIVAQPDFTFAEIAGDNLRLRWAIERGKEYRLESSEHLLPTDWQELDVVMTLDGREMEALVSISSWGRRYFRVREF